MKGCCSGSIWKPDRWKASRDAEPVCPKLRRLLFATRLKFALISFGANVVLRRGEGVVRASVQ